MPRTSAITELARMLVAGGMSTDPLDRAPTVADVRELARRRLPRMAFDFVDGGAGKEVTLRANESDFADVLLRPRSLVDVAQQSLTTTLAGQQLPMPLLLAPCGLIRVVGGDGELAAVRAAGKAGVIYTISTASSWSIEEIAAEATGPLWFQLYLWRSREVIGALVRRAKESGCQALVVTVDVVVNAKRPRDHRNGMSIPPQVTLRNVGGALRHPAWFASLLRGPPIGFRNLQGIAEGSSAMSHQDYVNTQLANVSATWDDIAWLRRQWDGPLFIKAAAHAGADGVFVSNHGGRQLDGVSSSIRALAAIVDAVGSDLDLILDSGIRSGGDVVKAVAVGARAVAIGRSWVWGAAAAGDRGVAHVLELYRNEVRETLTLLGCPDVRALDRSYVSYPADWNPRGGQPEPAEQLPLASASGSSG
jgi:L-lactate dehydrogenase (cytochrome)